MTVRELLTRIDARELAEWMVFYGLEPFGEEWQQTGTICMAVNRSMGGKADVATFVPKKERSGDDEEFWKVVVG